MATLSHSTPKVSAYSVYTRNKKLAEASATKLKNIDSNTEKKLAEAFDTESKNTDANIEKKLAEAFATKLDNIDSNTEKKLAEAFATKLENTDSNTEKKLAEAFDTELKNTDANTEKKLAEAFDTELKNTDANTEKKLAEAFDTESKNTDANTEKKLAEAFDTESKNTDANTDKKLAEAFDTESKNTDVNTEKKLAEDSATELENTDSNTEVKSKIANTQTRSARKRKAGAVQNGSAPVKGKRGRKKNVVQEETPDNENSLSDFVSKLEAEETENEDDINCFTPSTPENASGKIVACGTEAADEAFRWLLSPVKPDAFFEKKWEKKPFLIQRSKSNYYQGLYSTRVFEKIVKENNLYCEEEIDVVKFADGERSPLKTDMKVYPSFLCGAYQDGYTIRMRNPQVYHRPLASLCSLLQEYFGSFVGVNMYLTPANSQGFPPHYDDIDAFVLQIEGRKFWKLYTPSKKDQLARHPSADLTEYEHKDPYMEVELNPGDLLYFPRGYIHQAKAAPDMHSMHLTVSTNQMNTWGDFLLEAVPHALEIAMLTDVEFRKSLPKDYMDYTGCAYSDTVSQERTDFQKKVLELATKALNYMAIDFSCDSRGIDFIHGAMPPFFSEDEKACSVHGNGASIICGEAVMTEDLTLETKVRLIRRRAFRLVIDNDSMRIFHTISNGKNHKEEPERYMDVDADDIPVITELFQKHPEFIEILSLPHSDSQTLLDFAQRLYNNGFLMTEEPLPPKN